MCDSSWILKADKAASRWDFACPVGNGSLGAMNLGTFPKERIILNHDSIWSASPAFCEFHCDALALHPPMVSHNSAESISRLALD